MIKDIYKEYNPLTIDISKIKKITFNNNYLYDEKYNGLQFDYDTFNTNDTIILNNRNWKNIICC